MQKTRVIMLIGGLLVVASAQRGPMTPGKSIGSIATQGDLIVMTLDEGALGHANLFDLAGRTLRFTPDGASYRVRNEAPEPSESPS